MSVISSQSVGLNCRPVKHQLVYGKALSHVPANTVQLYSFQVMRLEPIQTQDTFSQEIAYSVQYQLVETEKVVHASNTGKCFVHQGNKVVLVENIGVINGEKTYDVYCDCSHGRFGVVIEPSIGMPFPTVAPNFTGCDKNGFPYTLLDFLKNTSCLNGRCAGTLALLDEKYYPLRAKYQGGEVYLDPETGQKAPRSSGEARFHETYDQNGNRVRRSPLYYMRRELVVDERTYYYKKREYANETSGQLPVYLNSPYLYRYVDGTECAFDMPPVFNLSRGGGGTIESWQAQSWKVTDDPHKAQLNYHLFLCPQQAENESMVPGSVVEIISETYTENYLPVRNASWGVQLNEYGKSVPFPVTIPYCIIEPPVSNWFAAIDGQVQTYGVRYTRDQTIPSHEDHVCTAIKEITARDLVDGFSDTVLEDLIKRFQWSGTAPDTQANRITALVMCVICSVLQKQRQDSLSLLSVGYLDHASLPGASVGDINGQQMDIAAYYERYDQFRMIGDGSARIYMYTWFKYILLHQMLLLEAGEDPPPSAGSAFDSYNVLTQHVMKQSAQLLSESIGDRLAEHPPGQEMILLGNNGTMELGRTPPDFFVRCFLEEESVDSVDASLLEVRHPTGTTGKPVFLSRDNVINRREWQPCRGCFTVRNNELVKFPNLFILKCQNDYGVEVRAHDPQDTTRKQRRHYLIQRELVDEANQKYELVLRSNLPYKHLGELMSFTK